MSLRKILGTILKADDGRTLTNCDAKLTKIPKTGLYFRTCEDGAGWHLIPYRISPRSEFFSQAYKNWHIT